MKNFLEKTKSTFNSKVNSIVNEIDTGMKIVKEVVNGLPILNELEFALRTTEEQQDPL